MLDHILIQLFLLTTIAAGIILRALVAAFTWLPWTPGCSLAFICALAAFVFWMRWLPEEFSP